MAKTPFQLNAYLESLSPKQRRIFDRLVKLLGKPRSLPNYHNAAVTMEKFKLSKSGYPKKWMEQLCLALKAKGVPNSPSFGYRLLKFVALFPGAQGKSRVKELDGKIPWDSMMRILHIETKAKQDEILAMLAKKPRSTRYVRRLISKKTPYRRSRGGNPMAKPEKHPNRALKSLLAFTAKWPEVAKAWLDKDGAMRTIASRHKVQPFVVEFLEDLKKASKGVAKVARSTERLSTKMSALVQKLEGK